MADAHRVEILRDGENQLVRIPREFELPGRDAIIRKEGQRLVIEPTAAPKLSLQELLASWEPLEDEFPAISDPPPDPVDL